MTEIGKVHFLTRIPGRKEVHLLGNADLNKSFKELMQLLSKIWGIEETVNCVLEYSGPLLDSPNEPIIIGTDEEWSFALEQFRHYIDSRIPKAGYVSSSGHCYSCERRRNPGCTSCSYCGSAAVVASAKLDSLETIPMLIRRKPSKSTAAELDVLFEDDKAAEMILLTKERDEMARCIMIKETELVALRAAFEAQTAELDKPKAAYAVRPSPLAALISPYPRKTGKASSDEDAIEQAKCSVQGAASASSAGDFDVVDDAESTA